MSVSAAAVLQASRQGTLNFVVAVSTRQQGEVNFAFNSKQVSAGSWGLENSAPHCALTTRASAKLPRGDDDDESSCTLVVGLFRLEGHAPVPVVSQQRERAHITRKEMCTPLRVEWAELRDSHLPFARTLVPSRLTQRGLDSLRLSSLAPAVGGLPVKVIE